MYLLCGAFSGGQVPPFAYAGRRPCIDSWAGWEFFITKIFHCENYRSARTRWRYSMFFHT